MLLYVQFEAVTLPSSTGQQLARYQMPVGQILPLQEYRLINLEYSDCFQVSLIALSSSRSLLFSSVASFEGASSVGVKE